MKNYNEFMRTHVDEKWQNLFSVLADKIEHKWEGKVIYSTYRNIANWSVSLEIFPEGYHCTKGEPLPFLALSAQKRHFAFYYMGLSTDTELLNWFQTEYALHVPTKLNMGKSCIRLTNPNKVPLDLLCQLIERTSLEKWIEQYQSTRK